MRAGPHPRSAIRAYAMEIIKDEVDVGRRVYADRPSEILKYETPCVLVYFADEPARATGGTEFVPRVHDRTLTLNCDILQRELIRPDIEIHDNQETEDFIDARAWELELAFLDDLFFGIRLNGYDPNTNMIGLLDGMRLVGTVPYNMDSEGDTRILATRIQWELLYNTAVQGGKKYDEFKEYYAAIIRVNSTPETVDRVLIEAQGELE